MNGHSYGGRLNYLFLSGSCVIILKNAHIQKTFEEFFYKYFIPGEDYIEVVYHENENIEKIIDRIKNSIIRHNGEEIAKRCYIKAMQVFKMNQIYDYIYQLVYTFSKQCTIDKHLDYSIFYTPNINDFYKYRIQNNYDHMIHFFFKGKGFEIQIKGTDLDFLHIKIINNQTKIIYNQTMLLNKYTPYIVQETKNQYYEFSIEKNQFYITIDRKFQLIKCMLPINDFKMNEIDIQAEQGGWWMI